MELVWLLASSEKSADNEKPLKVVLIFLVSPNTFVNAGESDERLPEFSVSATIPAGHVQLFHAAGAQALAHKRVY